MGISKSRPIDCEINSDDDDEYTTIVTDTSKHILKKNKRIYVLGNVGLSFVRRDGKDFIECMYCGGCSLEMSQCYMNALDVLEYSGIAMEGSPTDCGNFILKLTLRIIDPDDVYNTQIKVFPYYSNMRLIIVKRV